MIGGPYAVDWDNDGTFDEFGLANTSTHDYGVSGTYTIRIRGTYDAIRFDSSSDYCEAIQFDDGGDAKKILSLDQWGTQSWTSMMCAFVNAKNLTIPATDTPNFSAVTDMSAMFWVATSANPDTSSWDTAAVTDMFAMFLGAASANPDTSSWNTAAVTDMGGRFYDADQANPDTSGWDTAAVNYMDFMFRGAASANPDTSNWNTAAVTDMSGIFYRATAANPDTSGWNTSSVSDMTVMFAHATSFNQDIGSWDITSLTDATEMFTGVTLSTQNYDSLLTGWSKQVLQPGVSFSGGNSTYCTPDAIAARASMIASDSWVITDGGQACPPQPPDSPAIPPDLTPETDTGISDSDDFTTDSTPNFYVDCSVASNTITLYTDNPVANTAVGLYTCVTNGIETASVSIPLVAGIHNITYTDSNADGESGHSPSLAVTIDTIFASGFE